MNKAESTARPPLNDKKTITAWALFDWANSAFALVITVAIFPSYFEAITDDTIRILGMDITNSAVYALYISASYLIIALFSPLLSGIADYGGRKMYFLKIFTTIGAISCMSLFFFKGMENIWLGSIGFILGMIGFAGGLVFYNSYLPEIATEDQYDRVSAKGFSYGFIGSVILMGINLIVIMNPHWFGITDDLVAVRIAFIMVGVWWLGFAQIPFRRLPKDSRVNDEPDLLRKGAQELKKVWQAVKKQGNIKSFLFSFFSFIAGVQTVLYLASTYAQKELSFSSSELLGVILFLQIVGAVGAYAFAALSSWKGNKFSMITILILWTAICVFGYFMQTRVDFYIIAGSVGMVMGGTQSLSRSTYSKLLPVNTEDITSYFSFYDVLEKVATVLGTLTFAIVNQVTGSMRTGVLFMVAFFIIGLGLFLRVKIKPAEVEVALT